MPDAATVQNLDEVQQFMQLITKERVEKASKTPTSVGGNQPVRSHP